MKMKTNSLWLLLLLGVTCFGQMDDYSYKQELSGISDTWHTIKLPNVVMEKTNARLTDLRIYGLQTNDTIEAPFLIRSTADKVVNEKIPFKQLNTTFNDSGYFVTFEVPMKETINRIETTFKQTNFDWQLKLEGSQNQEDWFTLLDNHRILSIKNAQTNYQYTDLIFPEAKYRYYRIQLKTKEKVNLTTAKLLQRKVTPGTFQTHPIKGSFQKDNSTTKLTEFIVFLDMPLSVSQLKLTVQEDFDYYRPITIQALTDSVPTSNGYRYNYRTLTSGTLNSIESNEFTFPHTVTQQLKIIIKNQDNQPLTIGNVTVQGHLHQLIARFTEPGDYILVYGNKSARKPQYDIQRFTTNIPAFPNELVLGERQTLDKTHLQGKETKPLFENPIWLWLIMGLVILMLGGFTISMLRKV